MPRRDPFEEIEELFDRLSSGFGGVGEELGTGFTTGIDVDVADDGDEVVVHADLPGYDKEDIDVTVQEDSLRIVAEHEEEREEEAEERSYYRRERSRRRLSRTVRLPTAVEEDRASASYTNGVLTVRLPKAAPEDGEGHSIDIS